MTDDTRVSVTVLGLGSMGSAVAAAFVAAGHPTTVWNRSPGKAAPLVALGATHAATIDEAVAASPLIVSVLTGFEATLDALAPAGAALAGRTLITLNSGAPAGAREVAVWADAHGARFLGGAIKNVPAAVGAADTLLYYGGDRGVFDEYRSALGVLGGENVHLGDEPDLAALYEAAVGATLLPTLLGFFEGAAVLASRGIEARAMVPYSAKWLRMIESLLPLLAEEIDTGDYTKLGSSVGLFHDAVDSDMRVGVEAGVDMSWHAPMAELLHRAIARGHREHSVTALIEVLKNPAA
ncbi:3-hydroxyisobutyrate dehydrogenase [Nocardia amikacinitolerans]|uniref:3-hydroxyisobutyrate dehydrogenase n=1 Tax=Nocardia amikacinitolerans TaxID=756689 RepID=A0A285LX62_9NOCA|nr:NAD(P)-binding domain-containing protein [Nocardia amikacinitolerans]SNY88727.1 3-hydroxyisobutyrate dehydrogenase [Nocardia amikacinitolerans]